MQGAVAAGGDDDLTAFADRFGGEPARIPGSGSELERALRPEVIQVTAEAPGFFASGRWIKDDANAHSPLLWAPAWQSRGESCS